MTLQLHDNGVLPQAKNKKAEQARINGAKSHGPTSTEGKARSSRNSIRHGMTANEHTVLEAESLEEYDEVRSAFIAQFHPATKAELRLVEKIANLDWRLERLAMMETSLLDMRADLSIEEIRKLYPRMDGIGTVVLSWLETNTRSGCSDLLRRYMGTLQHQFDATLNNFRNMKKDRIAEATAGDTFERPLYLEPKFETLLPSEITQLADVVSNTHCVVIEPAALPSEPTHRAEIHCVAPIPERPAA